MYVLKWNCLVSRHLQAPAHEVGEPATCKTHGDVLHVHLIIGDRMIGQDPGKLMRVIKAIIAWSWTVLGSMIV